MAKTLQFDEFEGSGTRKSPPCMACEEMLADALDGTLGGGGLDDIDQAWFDQHVAGCAACSGMVADAQRGAAWLELLKSPRPEPSAALLERILAETSGGQRAMAMQPAMVPAMLPVVLPVMLPATVPANLLAFPPRAVAAPRRWAAGMFEPRLAMTAAMAFFSMALTLNLTGVKLNEIHLSDVNPAGLKHSYYEANAKAVRYYDNLRVVRVLESRVEDLRQSNLDEPRSGSTPERTRDQAPANERERQPETKPDADKSRKGPGVSRETGPFPERQGERVYRGNVVPVRWLVSKASEREGGLV